MKMLQNKVIRQSNAVILQYKESTADLDYNADESKSDEEKGAQRKVTWPPGKGPIEVKKQCEAKIKNWKNERRGGRERLALR